MALRYRRQWLSGFTVLAMIAGFGWAFAQPDGAAVESPDPVTLAPQGSLLFFTCEGALPHAKEWQQTAAYKALYESGLADLVTKVLDFGHQLAGQQGAGPFVSLGREFLNHVREHGITLAATINPPVNGPPTGYAILVLHNAARFEEPIGQFVVGLSQGNPPFEQSERSGRLVTSTIIPDSPGVEVGWWQERGHLVVVAGLDAINLALAVANGEAPNATQHPLYAKYIAAERDFITTAGYWFDAAAVRQLVSGIPLPVEAQTNAGDPLSVGHIIELLGFSQLNSLVGVSGFKGPASWSEGWVEAPGPRTGFLALSEGPPLTLADLPPLPTGLTAFTATRFQPESLYDEVLGAFRKLAALAPPDEQIEQKIDDFLAQARERLGLDIRADLLEHLGDVLVAYNDNQQGLLNMGAGFLVKLDDPVAFQAGVVKLLAAVERESDGQVLARRVQKQGRELLLLQAPATGLGYSFAVDGDWLVFGSTQVIEAYLLRVDGKLPRWTPDPDHAAALAAMPQSFSAISVSDPRGFINLLAGLAPFAMGLAETGLRQSGEFPPGLELPIHAEDFPPAELVSRPLFPNVGVVEVTADGFHSIGRSSLPGIPFSGSSDAATTTAVVAIGVALLLPAVQQARMAARRAQSQNNLRQLAIAMHNYENAHRAFPAGTILNSNLEPEQRLSWIVELLPYVEQQALYNQLNRSQGWEHPDNLPLAAAVVELFLNAGVASGPTTFSANGDLLGSTHYVGIAGLGEDGPRLPAGSPRAGIFAYDRKTRIGNITDGTSNTLMISEATGEYGGWAQGGRATIRSLTQQPYVNGVDGIGGPYPGGFNASFADGSTRFLSQDIDPAVMEAIATMAGGEAVNVP